MSTVIRAISEFFPRYALTGSGIVAVSGGADSVALLRGLVLAGVPIAAVAHLNHQLRGEDSDADEAFVIQLAQQLQLNYLTSRVDLQAYAQSRKQNLEAAAREYRYEFLADVAERFGASWIATGHTANDQAETLLHRLIRGTGLQGLRGIAPNRVLNDVVICRPLLQVERGELLAFLEELDQPYRTDSSNADTAFTRNRIRAELLPLMQRYNPEVIRGLGQLASQCEELFSHMQEQVRKLLELVELPRAGDRVILKAAPLQAESRWLVTELFRHLWEREGWPCGAMTASHWQRVADIALGQHNAADFPDGLFVKRVNQVVQLGRRS